MEPYQRLRGCKGYEVRPILAGDFSWWRRQIEPTLLLYLIRQCECSCLLLLSNNVSYYWCQTVCAHVSPKAPCPRNTTSPHERKDNYRRRFDQIPLDTVFLRWISRTAFMRGR